MAESLEARVAALEAQVADMRDAIASLEERASLDEASSTALFAWFALRLPDAERDALEAFLLTNQHTAPDRAQAMEYSLRQMKWDAERSGGGPGPIDAAER